jgi:hypothetical protein
MECFIVIAELLSCVAVPALAVIVALLISSHA